jgi:hypothetical protein
MMSLVERLMGLEDPKISVHEFAASCFEIVFGPRTVQQTKTYYKMDAAAQAEFDSLMSTVKGTDMKRFRTIFMFEQVFILAEHGAPLYSTPSKIRIRLNI